MLNEFNLEALKLDEISHLWEELDGDFNLPLIIGLSTGLGVLFLTLLVLTLYFSFFNNGGSIFLGSNFNIPGEFDDEESRLNDETEHLPKFTDFERQNYFDGLNYQEVNPPQTNPIGATLTEEQREYIVDRGIQAYLFQQENVSALSESIPSVIIEDKLDVRFTSSEPNSAILNYPLPVHDNDTVYFEVKLYEFPQGSKLSIGVATKPYPGFRLPGYNKYSIAYESNGTVRINQPFYSPQIWTKLIEGDVLGVGFKPRSGTIFFTHNGKKLLEAVHGVRMDLFPIIGSQGPSKLNVNLGQLGFVFIEANVKKWGFGSVFGTIGIPPAYGKEIVNDTVLDKGEELPPNYPSEEETFFGPSALLGRNNNESEQEARPTKVISSPPSYSDEPKQELVNDTQEVDSGIDEIRERLYERRSSTFDQQNNHYDPLALSSEPTPKPSDKSDEVAEQESVKVIESKESPKHIDQQAQEPAFETIIERTQGDEEPEASQSTQVKEPQPQQKPSDEAEEDEDDENDESLESTPEATPEVTPEPGATTTDGTKPSTPSSSSKKNKNKKKKKKSKKKGKK